MDVFFEKEKDPEKTDINWQKGAMGKFSEASLDVLDDMGRSLPETCVQYIAKDNKSTHEFHYAHPSTKNLANKIFNTHFYGAPFFLLAEREA